MTENELQITVGDWFVHARFGVGQVKGQAIKIISGREQIYYEIETSVCTLWLPPKQIDGQKIRPLTAHDDFQQVIKVLKKPAKEMALKADKRKMRIERVKSANTPKDTARLVRDLWARQNTEGKLYDWERQAWRDFSTILIQEWALCQGISPAEARQQMARNLRTERSTPAGEPVDEASPESVAARAAKMHSLLQAATNDEQKWANWMIAQRASTE